MYHCWCQYIHAFSVLFQLKLSLIDFSWTSSTRNPGNQCKMNYGYIYDTTNKRKIPICGGGERQRHLYESAGNVVHVVLSDEVKKHSYKFLIEFTGILDHIVF